MDWIFASFMYIPERDVDEKWISLFENAIEMNGTMYKLLYDKGPIFGIKYHVYYIILYYCLEFKNIWSNGAAQSKFIEPLERDNKHMFNLFKDIQLIAPHILQVHKW